MRLKLSFIRAIQLSAFLMALTSVSPSYSGQITLAVASNFNKTLESVVRVFEQKTGHKVRLSFGPTGKLFAQIKHGAPFDAFLAADEERPKLAIQEGFALAESYFVYAQGQIVLFSQTLPVADTPIQSLKNQNYRFLAMANPKTAPYGDRSYYFLDKNDLLEVVQGRLAQAESIAQAYQFVVTGNAQIGFLALSQVVDPQSPLFGKGQYWRVPPTSYPPINQAAVILKRGQNNPVVHEFFKFLKSDEAIALIKKSGYSMPSDTEVKTH
jgi:molybdate transport system substrate-binding protein